jgi:hypothetical protein
MTVYSHRRGLIGVYLIGGRLMGVPQRRTSHRPGAGGRAKRPTDSDDLRFRPDWSAVKENYMILSTPRSYFNFCPGDTKLTKKWKFEWYFTDLDL